MAYGNTAFEIIKRFINAEEVMAGTCNLLIAEGKIAVSEAVSGN